MAFRRDSPAAQFVLRDPVRHELQTAEDEVLITSTTGREIDELCPHLTRPDVQTPGFSSACWTTRWVVELFTVRWAFAPRGRRDYLPGSAAKEVAASVLARARDDVAFREALLALVALAEDASPRGRALVAAVAPWVAAHLPGERPGRE